MEAARGVPGVIAADQPDCFDGSVLVRFSSKHDGTVLDRSIGIHDGSITSNRTRICKEVGFDYGDAVFQRIVYSPDATYRLIADVDARSTSKHTSEVVADTLFTEVAGIGLFLPVADCVATVVHDPVGKRLALLHLGRHSTLTDLISRVVKHFELRGSLPSDLIVWMSPSAQRESYRLEHFASKGSPEWQPHCDVKDDGVYLDMQGYNRQRFIDCGVEGGNIYASPVNTMVSDDYFSHATGDTHGRMAAIAMMR